MEGAIVRVMNFASDRSSRLVAESFGLSCYSCTNLPKYMEEVLQDCFGVSAEELGMEQARPGLPRLDAGLTRLAEPTGAPRYALRAIPELMGGIVQDFLAPTID